MLVLVGGLILYCIEVVFCSRDLCIFAISASAVKTSYSFSTLKLFCCCCSSTFCTLLPVTMLPCISVSDKLEGELFCSCSWSAKLLLLVRWDGAGEGVYVGV